MIIAFGCDHAGYIMKNKILEYLNSCNHKIIDCGCFSKERCDYPDFALPVAKYVSKNMSDCGILVCTTGIGMSMVANKVRGIRAAVCYSDETARLVSEHNKANVLCVPAQFFPVDDVIRWIKVWMDTPFSSEIRHARRVRKIDRIAQKYCKRI